MRCIRHLPVANAAKSKSIRLIQPCCVHLSVLGRFVVDMHGPCFDVAMALCRDCTKGILVTDGVRDLACHTHEFVCFGSDYLLKRAITYPYQQTHDTLFGDEWRKVCPC